jgi:hypothetical protein
MTKAPKLPATVKIGHLDFSIVLASAADIGAYGDCNIDEQRIRIDQNLKPQTLAETLMHEILHAGWPTHMKGTGGKEEEVVSALSPNLAQIWRDNTVLIQWITHSLAGH